jgi:hypothetical protein
MCSSEGTARVLTAHPIHKPAFVQCGVLEQVILKLLSGKSPNRQVQAYLK